MIYNDNHFENAEAGIISFKNLNSGFLNFAKKEKPGKSPRNVIITKDVLDDLANDMLYNDK